MPHDLRFDVSSALPQQVAQGAPQWIAAWLFMPPHIDSEQRQTVLVCLHGGSYDKRYYHLEVPGCTDYSMAAHLAEQGNIVLVFDWLGVGDSSRPADPAAADRHVVAAAHHAAASQAFDRLMDGTLHPDLPALPLLQRIGVGHASGAMLAITQQAGFATFDRLVLMGYTAQEVVREPTLELPRERWSSRLQRIDEHYLHLDRQALRTIFHWPDVPAALLVADDASAVPLPAVLAEQSVTPGIVAEDAARLEVPLFLCLGERDISPAVEHESACYASASHLTFLLLSQSGHCHNFSSRRRDLWERIHQWAALDRLPDCRLEHCA